MGEKQLILLILIENYLDFIEHKMSWEKADLWPKAHTRQLKPC